MANKFKAGDKVVEKGTTYPIMTVLGFKVKPNLPSYQIVNDKYICAWHSKDIEERKEFDESELIKLEN
ncbi:MAG: hypothetical protein RLZ47_1466 [Bacteroidota bacterium]|jgi:uncharacterized protein YodC (DUF2158 family)